MDVWSIIGWGGSALVVVSLLQTRILRLRVLNLIGCLVLVAFNLVIGVWPMVGMNAVLAVINVVQLYRLLRHRHDPDEYTVLEVNAGDAYLRHVIDAHGRDIRKFNPDFTAPAAPYAFLVQHGDRTVGVVLAHDAGAGRAQIDLDYVLPEYRDFTPGEFVYRRSDVFTDHGFQQVMAPRRMRESASYLSKLGFRRDGSDLVLDLR
ncbi:inner membrane protein [Kribbella amoyensis]|uniref:Inner membrane protein n=1 Tax=Kribbella amoyensis TaxID=996641 RepID=A0A561BP27_9ACTN|nr:YgjV family protein [Kribbella amoyensis]TWD80563.1 inner membrane protein [Kribbella amoyensis]